MTRARASHLGAPEDHRSLVERRITERRPRAGPHDRAAETRFDVAAKVAFLRSSAAFDPPAVEVIETHMSWVFLTAEHAWKLKKPVRLPYLDYGSIERRHESCRQELGLGRRLATTVYLDVVALVAGPRGLAIGSDGGEVVDWLVKMRRLPADRMLPQLFARGAATVAHADAVAGVLAPFYRDARRAPWDAGEYRTRLRALTLTVAGELAERSGSDLSSLVESQLAIIERDAPALDARVAAGRVVDAHGDLRPEHVCLETPPVVIDPLEFDIGLRTMDAASELAFFCLECERLDAAWFGDRVVDQYATLSGDRAPPALVTLYRGHHALTRALIALRHADDAPASARSRWTTKATDYLARARRRDAVPSA